MRRLFSGFSGLKRRFFMATLGLGLGLCSVVIVTLMVFTEGWVKGDSLARLNDQTLLLDNQISAYLATALRDATVISTDNTLRFLLEGPTHPFYRALYSNQVYRTLMSSKAGEDWKDYYLLIPGDGLVMSTNAAENTSGLDIVAFDFVKPFLSGVNAYWIPRFETPIKKADAGMAYVTALRSNTGSAKLIGVLVVTVRWDTLDGLLSGSSFLNEDCVLVLDDEGRPVYSSRAAGLNMGETLSGGQTAMLMGAQYLQSRRTLARTGWSLVCLRSMETLNRHVRSTQMPIYLAALIFLLTYAGASLMLAGYLTGPIRRLSDIMLRADAMGYRESAPFDTPDEIGRISRSYNAMTRDILRNHVLRRQAELAALEAQINPHFLYNAIESIKAKASEHGEDEVRQMVQKMGEMFRYSLNRERSEQAYLREELGHIENYLFFQRVRFDERLRVSMDIAPETLPLMLPRFVLQPLVENCFAHAMDHAAMALHVSIRAWLDDGMLRFEIADDGCGMPDSAMQALDQRLAMDNADIAPGGSIGLNSVARRLRLYFGAEAGLSLSRPVAGGFCVTLNAPARNGEVGM